MRSTVRTSGAPLPVGAYSQGVIAGNLLFTAGQIGMDPEGGRLEEGVRKQTARALANVIEILEAAGTGPDRIVKMNLYITDMADFAVVNEVYSDLMDEPFPARSVVEVSALPLGALVEIEAVAQIKEVHQ